MKIQLDMYQTIAVAVVVLMLGKFLKERVSLLERFCIPAPVIGGVIFAIFTCLCYVTGIAEFSFDDILKEVCMVFFFTSVGFQANLKVLKSGGKSLIVFLGHINLMPEFHCDRACKAFAHKSASRALYRFDSDDRRAWNCRRIWSGS